MERWNHPRRRADVASLAPVRDVWVLRAVRNVRAVEAVRYSLVISIGLFAMGCVDIKGGAVEVPWAIFDANGRAINDCACAVEAAVGDNPVGNKSIAFVRLDLVSATTGDAPCAGLDSCRFACSRRIGATPFMIPGGQYQMSLTPLAADGTELSIRSTPAVSRGVVVGQPTELGAFEFMAGCASGCNGGSATQPCTGG
jgi:hypothetical protein